MAEMTRPFIAAIEAFADREKVPLLTFKSGQRKEDVAQQFLAKFPHREGVLFVGKAQEKALVVRTVSRKNPDTGRTYPWLMKSSAMVNHYYFYCVDEDFGLFFIKFCSYFPYNGRLCLNGHEYAKRQLEKRGIAYEPLDNGILSCADPEALQAICDSLTPAKIQALWQKWAKRLPHPFPAKDRAAGFRYEIFLQQVEFARTQVFDRPLSGRLFFEQVSMKQYFKEGRALRTELTVNNTWDFRIGKALKNLPQLRELAFTANRRLLHVQQLSQDPTLGDDVFRELTTPQVVDGQRVSALRFGDEIVLAVLGALLMFRHVPRGFTNSELRRDVARLLARQAQDLKPGQMTYHLRRLRLRGLICRVPGSHRYVVTEAGLHIAQFYVCTMSRVIRPTLTDHATSTTLLNRLTKAIANLGQPPHHAKT